MLVGGPDCTSPETENYNVMSSARTKGGFGYSIVAIPLLVQDTLLTEINGTIQLVNKVASRTGINRNTY